MEVARPEAAVNFIGALHAFTTGLVAFQTLPNADEIATRQQRDIKQFVRAAEQAKLDAYHCPVALRPDADIAPGETILRSKRNAAQAGCIWTDIDLKDITISLEDAEKLLKALRFPPSFIVWSGNGLHPYWLLSEAFDVEDERERFEAVLRRLIDRFGGDPAPAHIAALMRLPGTHNRKRGECKLVTVEGEGRRYHFEDLEEWLDEQPIVIQRKPSAIRAGGVEPESNPFLTAAREYGWKPTLDVEGELARMEPGNIHHTCVRVSASLLRRGMPLEDVVVRLLGEIERAKAATGEPFQERREERRLRAMCRSWIAKHPVEHRRKEERIPDEPGEVHEYDGARAKKRANAEPSADDKAAVPSMVADGVIEALRSYGMNLMLADGEMWVYHKGIWSTAEAGHEQRIRALIQTGCDTFGKSHDSKVANAAWKRLNEHPALYRASVPWLSGPVIAAPNGLLDVLAREFSPHRPDAYARRKIGAAYMPGAQCPAFLGFMESLFSDRDDVSRSLAVGLVQEWFGTMLAVGQLYREERKALLLLGPSRTGKTELSRFARMLVGSPVAAPSVSEISERFGLSSFYGATAWIRDDAINEGDQLDPQRFKTIVTGEPIDIEIKNRPAVRGVELAMPVLLTTNALPRAKDASDAIFNRALILEMTNEVSEDQARAIRLAIGVPRGQGLAQWVFEQEGAGILNWALDGLERLLERGQYLPPEFARTANQRFKDDNNPVSEFARTALRPSKTSRVSRHDLLCAYHGWQLEMEGEAARALGARAFFPRLRASVAGLADMQEHGGARYLTGLALTDEGLSHWKRHNDGPQLKGGSRGVATDKEQVNKLWNIDQITPDTPF